MSAVSDKKHYPYVSKQVRKAYSEPAQYVADDAEQVAVVESRPTVLDDEILDVTVSFDGTWQKRGRTSHNGVGEWSG